MSNKNKKTNKLDKPITGTIDQVLEHCLNSDFDITDEQYKKMEYEKCIDHIVATENVSREEAIEIYNEIALQEVKTIVDKLVQEGLMEVKSYGENGEPKFGLTELGEKCAESLKEKMDRKI